MNSTSVNEFGRDPEKGEVVFLAQCQCFRAEYEVVKRNSSFLADIYTDNVVRFPTFDNQVSSHFRLEPKWSRIVHST